MVPEDLNENYIAGAKYLHLTGILPALSESCHRTPERALFLAKKHGVQISFDPNPRLKLWSKERAGDGFAAGILSGLLRNLSLPEAVELANRVGAHALTVAGDVEGYPSLSQIRFDADDNRVTR